MRGLLADFFWTAGTLECAVRKNALKRHTDFPSDHRQFIAIGLPGNSVLNSPYLLQLHRKLAFANLVVREGLEGGQRVNGVWTVKSSVTYLEM